jgi:Aldo/keto reductase family
MRSSRGLHARDGSNGCGEMRTARGDDPTLACAELDVKTEEHKHGRARHSSLCEDPPHPRSRCNSRPRVWHADSRSPRDQTGNQDRKKVGFRHFDCAERYRNEQSVGDAMQEVFKAGTIERKDVFVTTKLWNSNHRPERVKPAFEASRRRLRSCPQAWCRTPSGRP